MRISIITLFICIATVQLLLAVPIHAQDMSVEKVTVGLKQEGLTNAIKQIEQQTSLRFFYRRTELESLANLNLPPARRTIEQTLYELLHNSGFSFRQIDQNILIEANGLEANAETRVTGKVFAADNKQPVRFASVELLRTRDLQLVGQGLTDSAGYFEVGTKDNDELILRVSLIGYHIYRKTDIKGSMINMPAIYLEPDPKVLQEVVIAAHSPLVKQEVDRLVYNVQNDPDSKSISLLDMLARVPLISVDPEGNIKLKGSASFKVLIDGRSSSLVVNDPKEIFRSMAASSIASIEVITVPPAKYDSEGLTGIINIITVKKRIDGYSGNVSLQYKYPNGPRSSANFIFKRGKFAMSVLGGYNIYNVPQTSYSIFQQSKSLLPGTTLYQQGSAHTDTKEGIFYSQYSYEADSLNLLAAVINYSAGNSHRVGSLISEQTDATIHSYQLDNDGTARHHGYDLGFDYQHGFKNKKMQLLSFSWRLSNNDYHQFNQLTASRKINTTMGNYTQENTAGTQDQTLELDYAQPMKNIMMEAGLKTIFRTNFSDYVTTLVANADHFDYRQNIYALYDSWQLNLHSWTIKAGGRLELTTLRADFSTAGSVHIPDYDRLVPSIAIQEKLSTAASINFGYTQRINRPGIAQLNPYIDRQNPGIISYGNPALQPELNHSFSVNYSLFAGGAFNTGISYSFSNNSIQYISTIGTDGVTNNTYSNLGKNATLSGYVSANYSLGPRISVNANGEIRWVHLTGTVNSTHYKHNALAGNSIITVNYKLDHDWRAGFQFQYYSPAITLQSTSSPYYYTSFSVAKNVFHKKLNITGSVSNPFLQYLNYKISYTDPNFSQLTQNDIVYRRFNLTFNYTFGKLRDGAVKKSKKEIRNDDISTAKPLSAPGN